MEQEVSKIIRNIENNIAGCDILNRLFNDMSNGRTINYNDIRSKGYKNDEIYLGIELIDLFMRLKRYIEQVDKRNENCI